MTRGRVVRQSQKEKYLEALEACGVKTIAARKAGMGLRTVYDHRQNDEVFRQAEEDAMYAFLDHVESQVWERAVSGWDEVTTYENGNDEGVAIKQTVTRRKVSDTLAIFMLKGHRPQKYRDNMSIEHQVSTADVLEEEIKQAMSRAGKAVDKE